MKIKNILLLSLLIFAAQTKQATCSEYWSKLSSGVQTLWNNTSSTNRTLAKFAATVTALYTGYKLVKSSITEANATRAYSNISILSLHNDCEYFLPERSDRQKNTKYFIKQVIEAILKKIDNDHHLTSQKDALKICMQYMCTMRFLGTSQNYMVDSGISSGQKMFPLYGQQAVDYVFKSLDSSVALNACEIAERAEFHAAVLKKLEGHVWHDMFENNPYLIDLFKFIN